MGELRLPEVQPLLEGTQMPPSEDVQEFNRSMTGSFEGARCHVYLSGRETEVAAPRPA